MSRAGLGSGSLDPHQEGPHGAEPVGGRPGERLPLRAYRSNAPRAAVVFRTEGVSTWYFRKSMYSRIMLIVVQKTFEIHIQA